MPPQQSRAAHLPHPVPAAHGQGRRGEPSRGVFGRRRRVYRQAIQHQDAAHAGQLAHRAAHQLRERYRQKLLTDPSEIQIESENDKFIDTLVKAIEQNIDNSEFGIQELCEISRYSYQQVYRKVKALTGESINEFIRTVRLKRAAQYLAQSDTRISEIMYSVGFNSHSYFTKCFREHFGLSPKEYAEKHRRK